MCGVPVTEDPDAHERSYAYAFRASASRLTTAMTPAPWVSTYKQKCIEKSFAAAAKAKEDCKWDSDETVDEGHGAAAEETKRKRKPKRKRNSEGNSDDEGERGGAKRGRTGGD
jgi:hypothetical protein